MAFGSFGGGDPAPMSEINTTPLVDVMLVLLVVFIVTAPVLRHSIKVDLPKASATIEQPVPAVVQLGILPDGSLQWDEVSLPATSLESRFNEFMRLHPEGELHIYADKAVRYEIVAQTMAAARRSGISKIGLMTEKP